MHDNCDRGRRSQYNCSPLTVSKPVTNQEISKIVKVLNCLEWAKVLCNEDGSFFRTSPNISNVGQVLLLRASSEIGGRSFPGFAQVLGLLNGRLLSLAQPGRSDSTRPSAEVVASTWSRNRSKRRNPLMTYSSTTLSPNTSCSNRMKPKKS